MKMDIVSPWSKQATAALWSSVWSRSGAGKHTWATEHVAIHSCLFSVAQSYLPDFTKERSDKIQLTKSEQSDIAAGII